MRYRLAVGAAVLCVTPLGASVTGVRAGPDGKPRHFPVIVVDGQTTTAPID